MRELHVELNGIARGGTIGASLIDQAIQVAKAVHVVLGSAFVLPYQAVVLDGGARILPPEF